MKRFLPVTCLLLVMAAWGLLTAEAQTPAPGATGTPFAVIDWRTCLALHPLMADFDFAAGRFSRPGIKRNDHQAMGDLYTAMAQKKKAIEPRRLDLERQRNALQLQLNNLDLQQTQSILGLASGSQNASRGPLTPEKVDSRRRELADKLAGVVRQSDGLNDQIWNDLFLSAEETDRRLQQIVAEVDGALKETAIQYRVTAVIDDTLMAASMPSDIVRDVPESTPLWTNSVYRMILDSPFPEPGKASMANHWAAELQKNLERQVAAYLATRPDLGPLAGGFRAPRLFVMGGTDLTLPVCERIFARYRLNPYLIQALRKGILSFRR